MAMRCEICGKGPVVGRRVSHAHNVRPRRFEPNLQTVRAVVDGAHVDPILVHGDFLGVPVPAGAHHVVVEFAPASFTRGWQISLFGVLLTAGATLTGARARSRGRDRPTPLATGGRSRQP